MPRLKNQPPAYRLHKPSGQAVITFQGKQHYLGRHGSKASNTAYQKFVDLWNRDRAAEEKRERAEVERKRQLELLGAAPSTALELRDRFKSGDEVYVVELAKTYCDFSDTYYRKNGTRTREAEMIREVGIFLSKHFGMISVSEFDPVALDDLRELMIDERDWSRKYINKQCERVIRMFRWGVAKSIAPPGSVEALRALAGLKQGRTRARETDPIKPVDDKTVEQTLPHLAPVVADMVRFERLTGCRPGEVCSLRPCNVDRKSNVWRYTPDSHKTEHRDRQRVIFVGPKAQDVLRRYLLRPEGAYCFSPAEAEKQHREARAVARKTPLRYGNRGGTNVKGQPQRRPGKRYITSSYRRAIERACKKAFPSPYGYDADARRKWQKAHRWHPNQLRHSAATEVRKAFGLEAAQVVLGHASADISQMYAERDEQLAASVAERLG